MKTLLLRLAAPMQAWGDESKYDIRGTRNEPTKSGVIGLIAAALGYSRDSEEIPKLAEKLRIGVRVDQPGTVVRDFHTALAPKYSSDGSLRYTPDGSIIMDNSPYVTKRYYICDAVFLVGIECDDKMYLEKIERAIKSPTFPLFLGRKSCPITLPINLGVFDGELETVLQKMEWIASDWYKEKHGAISAKIITESNTESKSVKTVMDQPISFSPIYRQYTLRGLNKTQYVVLGKAEHDPMAVL